MFKHQYFQMFGVKLNGSNFRPLEVVGRGSETLTLQNCHSILELLLK